MAMAQAIFAGVGRRPALVLALFAALLATQIRPWWPPAPDACGYLSMARSIAHGGPVTTLGSPKLHFAPGYPLLVSPAFWTGDRPFLLLSIVQWLLAVVFMLGVYRGAKRLFPGSELWITGLIMANASLWLHARLTLSEMAFMAVLAWTANILDRLITAEDDRGLVRWTFAAALLIVALSTIRQVGIFVVPGYGMAMLIGACRGRVTWRRAIGTTIGVALPASLALLGLLAYETRMSALAGVPQRTYLDYFQEPGMSLTAQLLEGVRLRISEIGRLLVPGMFKAYAPRGVWLNLNMAVFLPLFAAVVWSWWRMARQGRNVLALTMPFYLGLYIVYPFDQGTRYLLPLLPLWVACVYTLIDQIPAPHRGRMLAALLVMHLGVAWGSSMRALRPLEQLDRQWPDVDALAIIVRHERGPGLAWKTPYGISEMLQLSSNRRIDLAETGGPIGAQVGWIVTTLKSPDCPGFAEYARAGELKLMRRAAGPAPALSQAMRAAAQSDNVVH
jgi:hypothetical protein